MCGWPSPWRRILDPEILIMDEVLAVGDAAFQQKCLGRMKAIAGEGRTILFVSHNLEAVRRLCTRGVWLDRGTLCMDDDIDQVVDTYSNRMIHPSKVVLHNHDLGLTVRNFTLSNQTGVPCVNFRPGDDLVMEFSFDARAPIDRPHFAVAVHGLKGPCFAANMLLDGHRPAELHGKGSLACVFKSLPLLPQNYTIQLAIRSKNGKDLIIACHDVASFSVSGNLSDYGFTGEFLSLASHSTSVLIPYEWRLPDGSTKTASLSPARE